MALTNCKECNAEISTLAKACPKCGAPVPQEPKTRWWLVVLMIAVGGFIAFAMLLPDDGSGRDRSAIQLCWSDYERKSLDPPTKRLVASMCEKMEQSFRQKYGVNP